MGSLSVVINLSLCAHLCGLTSRHTLLHGHRYAAHHHSAANAGHLYLTQAAHHHSAAKAGLRYSTQEVHHDSAAKAGHRYLTQEANHHSAAKALHRYLTQEAHHRSASKAAAAHHHPAAKTAKSFARPRFCSSSNIDHVFLQACTALGLCGSAGGVGHCQPRNPTQS